MYVTVLTPVTMSPTNILPVAVLLVYRAKLWGMFASLLMNVITTVDPAGTVILDVSNVMLFAVNVIVLVVLPAGDEVVAGTVEEVTVIIPSSPVFGSLRK